MARRDVMKLAERLSNDSGLKASVIYEWLMDVGKEKGMNPTGLDFGTRYHMVYLMGEHDWYRLEDYAAPKKWKPQECDIDYEQLILARQEQLWMD